MPIKTLRTMRLLVKIEHLKNLRTMKKTDLSENRVSRVAPGDQNLVLTKNPKVK